MGEKEYIGVDIGGTFIKLGIVNGAGEIVRRHKVAVDQSGEIPVMTALIGAVMEMCGSEGISRFAGIGVCAPGSIDSVNGKVAINAGNVPNWSGTEVRAILEDEFGLPAAVANDGNCAALGEAWIGAAKSCSDVVCVTLGTGVGGGIVSSGKLVGGIRGFAGEIGHFPTHAGEGEICSCGRRGCYERFASTAALVKKAVAVNADWTNGKEIFAALDNGSEDAAKVVDEWLDEVAYGIVGFVHVFNPQMVLIGGGVSAQEENVIKPLREKVMRLAIPDFVDGLEIRAAALGNDAGMVGAVRYLMDSRGKEDK